MQTPRGDPVYEARYTRASTNPQDTGLRWGPEGLAASLWSLTRHHHGGTRCRAPTPLRRETAWVPEGVGRVGWAACGKGSAPPGDWEGPL